MRATSEGTTPAQSLDPSNSRFRLKSFLAWLLSLFKTCFKGRRHASGCVPYSHGREPDRRREAGRGRFGERFHRKMCPWGSSAFLLLLMKRSGYECSYYDASASVVFHYYSGLESFRCGGK